VKPQLLTEGYEKPARGSSIRPAGVMGLARAGHELVMLCSK